MSISPAGGKAAGPHESLSVSVAMCTYNSERFLRPQLQSIAAQTRLPDEVVVCDDGSQDDTLKILRQWDELVPFPVRIVRNEKNLGYTKNFEQAMRLCTGDVIFLSDHDDVWMSGRVARCMEVFEKEPEVGLVTTNAEIVDAEGGSQEMTLREFVDRMHIREFWRFFFPPGQRMELWTGCTMAVRRNLLPEVFPIPETLACHDVWLYMTVPLYTKIRYLDACLIQYRLHGNNHSTAPTAQHLRENPSRWNYFNTVLETLGQHPQLFESLLAQAEKLPDGDLKTRYIAQLHRHQTHFQNRARIQQSFSKNISLYFSEIFSGTYFRHPQAFRSMGYDFLKGMGVK